MSMCPYSCPTNAFMYDKGKVVDRQIEALHKTHVQDAKASLAVDEVDNDREMSDFVSPAIAILVPTVGGFISGSITRSNIENWYEHLKRPSWRPPNWLFPIAWTGLYASMGYASYLVWRDGGGFDGEARLPLALYGGQLALNWAWTPIFFGAHKLGLATLEIGSLWGAIVATMVTFHPVNKTASYLMVPYLAWVTYATALTFRVWQDNKDRTD